MPLSEYRRMHPDLADELTDKAIEMRNAETNNKSQELQLMIDMNAAVVKSLGNVQKQLGALQKTIARRPTL